MCKVDCLQSPLKRSHMVVYWLLAPWPRERSPSSSGRLQWTLDAPRDRWAAAALSSLLKQYEKLQAPDPPSMRSNTQATICCSFVRTLQTLVEQSTTISDTRESFDFEPARLIASLVKNSLLYKSCFSMLQSRTTVPPGARPGRLQQRCHPLYCFARWTAKRWSMQPEMAL